MEVKLQYFQMRDKSRHFAELPEIVEWEALRDHILTLPGTKLTGYLTDHITEVWIDFAYRQHTFTVNKQFGDFWFFVSDSHCSDDILIEIVHHCAKMTGYGEMGNTSCITPF